MFLVESDFVKHEIYEEARYNIHWPPNTAIPPYCGFMLGRHRRQWNNSNATLGQCFVLAVR